MCMSYNYPIKPTSVHVLGTVLALGTERLRPARAHQLEDKENNYIREILRNHTKKEYQYLSSQF